MEATSSTAEAEEAPEAEPEVLYIKARISYHRSNQTIDAYFNRLLNHLDDEKIVAGFSIQTTHDRRYSYRSPVALLQIYDGLDAVALIHLSSIGEFPASGRRVLEHPNFFLVGNNVESDVWNLSLDYQLPNPRSYLQDRCINLTSFANLKLDSNHPWSLRQLVKELYDKEFHEEEDIRHDEWELSPLFRSQQRYAAFEAYAAYLLYYKLMGEDRYIGTPQIPEPLELEEDEIEDEIEGENDAYLMKQGKRRLKWERRMATKEIRKQKTRIIQKAMKQLDKTEVTESGVAMTKKPTKQERRKLRKMVRRQLNGMTEEEIMDANFRYDLPESMVSSRLNWSEALPFDANVTYLCTIEEIDAYFLGLLERLDRGRIEASFDAKRNFVTNQSSKLAVIQIYDGSGTVTVIHLAAIGHLPANAQRVIEHPNFFMISMSVGDLVRILAEDYNLPNLQHVPKERCIDLTMVAMRKLQSPQEKGNIRRLVKDLFNKEFVEFQCSPEHGWENVPLTDVYLRKAAQKVYATFVCYRKLMSDDGTAVLGASQSNVLNASGGDKMDDEGSSIPAPNESKYFLIEAVISHLNTKEDVDAYFTQMLARLETEKIVASLGAHCDNNKNNPSPLAVLGIYDGSDSITVINASAIGCLPDSGRRMIEHPNLFMVVTDVGCIWKLAHDHFDDLANVNHIVRDRCIDLMEEAGRRLQKRSRWQINEIVRRLFNKPLEQIPFKKTSGWTKDTLDASHVKFAAQMVYATFHLHRKLMEHYDVIVEETKPLPDLDEPPSRKRKVPDWMNDDDSDDEEPQRQRTRRGEPFRLNAGISYINTIEGANVYFLRLLQKLEREKIVAGFDAEWNFGKKTGSGKLALLQIYDGTGSVALLHLFAIGGLPDLGRQVIEHSNFFLTGVNVSGDVWKLARDYHLPNAHICVRDRCIELSKTANQTLKSSERWSLQGLVQNLYHRHLEKDNEVRTNGWEEIPLRDVQQNYAALDAYASFVVYHKLIGDDRYFETDEILTPPQDSKPPPMPISNLPDHMRVNKAVHVASTSSNTKEPQMFQMNAKIAYLHTEEDIEAYLSQTLERLDREKIVVGFGAERNRGKAGERPSLIEIYDGSDTVTLLQISAVSGLPDAAKKMIEHPNFIMTGANLGNDIYRLARGYHVRHPYEIMRLHCIELTAEAKMKINIPTQWNLRNLVEFCFHVRFENDWKTHHAWDQIPLPEGQQKSAAMKAYASYHVYRRLFIDPPLELFKTPGTLPELQLDAEIRYLCDIESIDNYCKEVWARLKEPLVVGFDAKWNEVKLSPEGTPVALLQIYEGDGIVTLIHLFAVKMFPESLRSLIQHPNFIMVGLGVAKNLWKISRDYGLPRALHCVQRSQDLSPLANSGIDESAQKRWTIHDLLVNFLEKKFVSSDDVRNSLGWEVVPLAPAQQHYSALHAYAFYLIHKALIAKDWK